MADCIQKGLISVIIPVYNVGQYLDRCISSVVGQSYKNLEIICINDGSTDDSLDICELWKCRDRRIRIIDKTNGGLGPARNDGVRAASGEYLLFVDSDDWIDENCVEILYYRAAECNADVVIFDYYLTTYDVKRRKYCHKSGRRYFDLMEEVVSLGEYPAMLSRVGGTVWNKLQKTEFVRKNGLTQPDHPFEDIGYVYRLLASAGRIAQVKKELYFYWINREESITNQSPHLEACKMALLEMRQALEDRDHYAEYYPFLEKYSSCYFRVSLKRLKPWDAQTLENSKQYYYGMYPKAKEIDCARFILIGDAHLTCILERVRYLNTDQLHMYSYSEFVNMGQAAWSGGKYALLDIGSLVREKPETEDALNAMAEVLENLWSVDTMEQVFAIETKSALGIGLYGLEKLYTDYRELIRENERIHAVFKKLQSLCHPMIFIEGPEDDKLFSDASFGQPLNNYWYYDVADRIRDFL